MPTNRSARMRMKAAVEKAVSEGNGFLANEITANVMVGTTMTIIFAVMLLCLLLNEIGVFTAERTVMRWAVAIAAFVEIPITILNSKYVGNKPWLRRPLMADLILVCAILSAALGHNVTLVMVFPVIVSTRYFDEKYTRNVAAFTIVIFALSSLVNGMFGISNLNTIRFEGETEIVVQSATGLRMAIAQAGYDKAASVRSLFLNDFLPRCFVFLALSVSCCYVAGRGKQMIEMQSENAKKTSRIETELDLATRIQTSMLPCLFPAFPEHGDIDLRAVYYPAKEVGGDFYDYFKIDDRLVGIVVADVSGKGVGAALFMTISKTVLKNQLQLGITPEQAIMNANRQLCENNDAGLFVTCWAGVYDTETGMLTFVNAGHNPPVLIRRGEAARFIQQRSGFVLAGLEDFRYRQETIRLEKDDEMVFYTDGVTEATNAQEVLFGEGRLLESLERCRTRSVDEQLRAVKADIDAFVGGAEQFDDITVMMMRIG